MSIASHLSASGATPFPLGTHRQFTTTQSKNVIPSFPCCLKIEDKTILYLFIYSVFHWLHFYYAIIIIKLRKNSNKCGVYVMSTKKKVWGTWKYVNPSSSNLVICMNDSVELYIESHLMIDGLIDWLICWLLFFSLRKYFTHIYRESPFPMKGMLGLFC